MCKFTIQVIPAHVCNAVFICEYKHSYLTLFLMRSCQLAGSLNLLAELKRYRWVGKTEVSRGFVPIKEDSRGFVSIKENSRGFASSDGSRACFVLYLFSARQVFCEYDDQFSPWLFKLKRSTCSAGARECFFSLLVSQSDRGGGHDAFRKPLEVRRLCARCRSCQYCGSPFPLK